MSRTVSRVMRIDGWVISRALDDTITEHRQDCTAATLEE
jgi:hypothetical protein